MGDYSAIKYIYFDIGYFFEIGEQIRCDTSDAYALYEIIEIKRYSTPYPYWPYRYKLRLVKINYRTLDSRNRGLELQDG